MAFEMLSIGLVFAFAGVCLCSQSAGSYQSPAIQQSQIKLEDIERDNLDSAYVQKLQQQVVKSSTVAPAIALQQQQQQSYRPQYFSQQPYQAQQQQQYYLQQPYQQAQQQYLAQPYQSVASAFDYPGVQYMFINPSTYNPTNQIYQQFYVPSAVSAGAQPSVVPQYVTKQSSPVQYQQQLQFTTPQEYKQQAQFVSPAKAQQVEYKPQQPQFAAPAQAQQVEFKQQQYTLQAPAFQYIQAPSTSAVAATPNDFSYITRHPVATPSAAAAVQFKAPAPAVQYKSQVTAPTVAVQPQFQYNAAVQPQFQFNAAVQPQFQYQQPQFYYTAPAATSAPAVQQSAKSQYSSGIKSTTPFPVKEFAYKFETPQPIPQQQLQQQSGGIYSTIK